MSTWIAGQLSLYDLLDPPTPSGPSAPGHDPQPGPESQPEAESPPEPSAQPVSPPEPSAQPESQPPISDTPVVDTPVVDTPVVDTPVVDTPVVDTPISDTPVVDTPVSPPPLTVEVTRSTRRRKTAQAQLVGSTLEVRIPAACSNDEERYFVDHFRQKFERSRAAAMVDLDRRAADLAGTYGLPAPKSIRWVSNQKQQWGSCTPSEGSIRLSDRMAGFPRWVIDYVIVHELAHLVVADHGPDFWKLVDAYPRTERARGYLLAKDGV